MTAAGALPKLCYAGAMRLLILAAAAAALLPAAAEARTSRVIPAMFRGAWESDLSLCGAQASESRLEISRTSVMGYEHGGTATRVRFLGPRTIRVDANVSDDMGETAAGHFVFRLSPDGRRLSQLLDSGETTGAEPLRRCPPGSAFVPPPQPAE
jgi:hypothetical protein